MKDAITEKYTKMCMNESYNKLKDLDIDFNPFNITVKDKINTVCTEMLAKLDEIDDVNNPKAIDKTLHNNIDKIVKKLEKELSNLKKITI